MLTPADPVNRALDALGLAERAIGSIYDGTTESEAARRIYGPGLRQLLRSAHWSFARFYNPMLLLGDRTGLSTTPQGSQISAIVEPPWLYAYAWPTDCLQPRWLPWCGNINPGVPTGNITTQAGPNVPLMTGLSPTMVSPWAYQKPARFLSSTSAQYPIAVGQIDWDLLPDIEAQEGVGIRRRRIILCNVPPQPDQNNNPIGPALVYTGLVVEPEVWDSLFYEAFVAVLASRLALSLLVDQTAPTDEQAKQRAAALQLRGAQIAIAKDAIREARVASANETGFPQSTDHVPDWVRAHRIYGVGGAGYGGWGEGPGYFWCGWDSMALADGSVY